MEQEAGTWIESDLVHTLNEWRQGGQSVGFPQAIDLYKKHIHQLSTEHDVGRFLCDVQRLAQDSYGAYLLPTHIDRPIWGIYARARLMLEKISFNAHRIMEHVWYSQLVQVACRRPDLELPLERIIPSATP